MTPKYAIETLLARGWTETSIAAAIGASQSTVNRVKNGMTPSWEFGSAMVKLAESERKKRRRLTA